MERFVSGSCAGYSIVTYVLGICDRHNDNIMVKKSGHLFHIDFGKFLGDYQMFAGNFRRDRTPFVLTPDMVYVINGCDKKPTQKFHDFVDLCCTGFNIVRKNGNLLLNLFALVCSNPYNNLRNLPNICKNVQLMHKMHKIGKQCEKKLHAMQKVGKYLSAMQKMCFKFASNAKRMQKNKFIYYIKKLAKIFPTMEKMCQKIA